MTNDEIAQKLALLPNGLKEENIQSWQHIVKLYEIYTSSQGGSRYKPLFDLVTTLSKFEQAKLFRAGASLTLLMISTKERYGLEKGDAYIAIDLADDDSFVIGYFTATAEKADVSTCKNNQAISVIQPLLDRLWNETRGKKSA